MEAISTFYCVTLSDICPNNAGKMIKTLWFYMKADLHQWMMCHIFFIHLKNLTFDIIHLRRGNHWIIRAVGLAVLTIALRIRLQNQT